MEDYRIQLETYSGPLDLLLYLIRREEVDICDIPIARILEQYLRYVRLLEELDPELVGDFLVMAATLMEIKSRMLLPRNLPDEAEGEDLLDPRADLVRQLLAYRSFREAAGELGRKADLHFRRFGRPRVDPPDDHGHVDLEDVQIWDLLQAFNKLMSSVGVKPVVHEVRYDDTPVALHALDISDRLQREGASMPFSKIFEGRTRAQMIGLFLALLELIRQRRVRIEQNEGFGEIFIHLLDATPIAGPADEEATEEKDEEPAEVEVFQEEEPVCDEHGVPIVQPREEEEEEDDFGRKLKAIEVGEVDLGRAERDDEPPAEDAGLEGTL
ncbi:MAG TPA: segregation/condensation protein A [Phycisphaerae bacterium]|nr:segregation/condensation protein A [Phycisphaerae bacterium]